MKKLLLVLICIGLLSNSLSAISPLRTWQCRPSSPRPDCSQAEKDAARNVFKKATAATLGTLAAILAALGITAGVYQLQKEQQIATESSPLTRENIEQSQQRLREAQQKLEEMERQRQQTIQQMTH